jgi:cysteine desulfurase
MIYLDHNASSPARPAVIDAVAGAMHACGNASSVHKAGRDSRAIIEEARKTIAGAIETDPKGVIFTSGATEANNAVLKSFAGKILVSGIEHPSVLEAAPNALRIPVGRDGLVDLHALESLLDGASLVCVMLVNNETGVIQPVDQIASMAKAKGVRVHCDAVQALGRIPVAMNVDYMTLSAHKIGGPQGVGALVVAPGTPPVKLIHGGGQERRARAGTENVAGIAGFAAAVQDAGIETFQNLASLRNIIEQTLPGITVFGQSAARVANTTCFALPGVPADTQLMALDLAGICVSSGSACSSGSVKPSHVLEAMGIAPDLANCALRVSLGWNTTQDDVDTFIATYKQLAQSWKQAA